MNTRERLIEAGLKLMQERGYQATGISDILAETNLPKGSFYHQFASKDEFTKEVIERYAVQESDRCQQILSQGSGSPLTRLKRYFKELTKVFGPSGTINGCLVGRLSLDGATESALLQHQLQLAFAGWQSAIEACLTSARSVGELSETIDIRSMSEFIVNNWEGALLRSQAEKSDASLKTFFRYTFFLLES